jgi:hypothetical protein
MEFCLITLLVAAASTCADQDSVIIGIEILTPTYNGADTSASTVHSQPAFITGLDMLRRIYRQFRVSHHFLVENVTTCFDHLTNVQDNLFWTMLVERRAHQSTLKNVKLHKLRICRLCSVKTQVLNIEYPGQL